MLFVFRNYDVQINEVGMKIMEHCCHFSPLPTCGISAATTTTLTETKAETTTTNKANKLQQRYASLQHLVDNRGQIVFRGLNFNNNIKSRDNDNDIFYTIRDIQSNIKKKKKQRLTPSVLQLHQGSLFKKKFSGQQQLQHLLRRTRERGEFSGWHLFSKAI